MPLANQAGADEEPFDVAAGRSDIAYFAKHFFPRHCRLSFSALHEYLFERRLAKCADEPPNRRGRLDVVMAPRGAAKSTLMSLVFPVHALLYGYDPYIVLFSATQRQASQRLANIRSMLVDNKALARAFPALAEGKKIPRASTQTLIVGESRMDAFSAGTEVRGINHGPWRPTWIILDDIERSDRVRSLLHRDALCEWFDEVIANLGNGYTNIDLIGTLLHRDALPLRLSSRSDTCFREFAAIESEARNQELWDAWRGIFHNLTDPDRIDAARQFFDERREEMLEGARVLWPEKEDYYALCALRERIGRRAFDKEKQNAPPDGQSPVFSISKMRYFKLDGDRLICDPVAWNDDVDNARPEVKLSELLVGGFLDSAMGGANGDYAAVATLGIDGAGYMYVLDIWLEKASPSRQVEVIFDLHARWNYDLFGVEGTAFQSTITSFFDAERTRRHQHGQPWQIHPEKIFPRGDKTTRISNIEPFVSRGWLLFNETIGKLFIDQLDAFPCGRHDDGPDALASAVPLVRERSGKVSSTTVPRRESARASAF